MRMRRHLSPSPNRSVQGSERRHGAFRAAIPLRFMIADWSHLHPRGPDPHGLQVPARRQRPTRSLNCARTNDRCLWRIGTERANRGTVFPLPDRVGADGAGRGSGVGRGNHTDAGKCLVPNRSRAAGARPRCRTCDHCGIAGCARRNVRRWRSAVCDARFKERRVLHAHVHG